MRVIFMLLMSFALTVVALTGRQASAREIDNFTHRYLAIADSLTAVDRFTNALLDRALDEANREGACDNRNLRAKLKKYIGATPVGQVESWASETPLIERTAPPRARNIYSGIPLSEYPLMVAGIGPSIRLAGHVIGTDKLGHFMAEGLHYYELVTRKHRTLPQAQAWGTWTEDTYFGMMVSGIKSYADLSANLAGFHFWSSILDGPHPYFGCYGGNFVRERNFTWAEYVTDAWDEAINCSTFSRDVGLTVDRNLRALGMTCPVADGRESCRAMGEHAPVDAMVSPVCVALSRSGR